MEGAELCQCLHLSFLCTSVFSIISVLIILLPVDSTYLLLVSVKQHARQTVCACVAYSNVYHC